MLKDRVIGLKKVKGSSLIPNPMNWRKHPEKQKSALKAILEEVGIVGALLVYETALGLMLIDGHLRAEQLTDDLVPVLVLDVTEEEANLLMVTHDPITALGEADAMALSDLSSAIQFTNPILEKFKEEFLAGLENIKMEKIAPEEFPEVDENIETTYQCSDCGYKWSGGT